VKKKEEEERGMGLNDVVEFFLFVGKQFPFKNQKLK